MGLLPFPIGGSAIGNFPIIQPFFRRNKFPLSSSIKFSISSRKGAGVLKIGPYWALWGGLKIFPLILAGGVFPAGGKGLPPFFKGCEIWLGLVSPPPFRLLKGLWVFPNFGGIPRPRIIWVF